MLILPSNCYRCHRCHQWKLLTEFAICRTGRVYYRKICKECTNKRAEAERRSKRKSRLKQKLVKARYSAVVRMCIEHPEIFEKVININSTLYRAIYLDEKEKIIKRDAEILEHLQSRPQNDSDFHRRKRAKEDGHKQHKWISLTEASNE